MSLNTFDASLLRAFVTVAEVRSFTRAGRMIGLTQSAISLQIRRLEESLEATLLHRTKREVQLTSEGEAFLVHAKRILAIQDEAVACVRRSRTGERIRLGLPDVYAERYLPRVRARFTERFPEVLPEIHCAVSTEVNERFDEGGLDLALTIKHDNERSGDILGEDPLHWVASPTLEVSDPIPLALYPPYCIYRARGLKALASVGRDYRIAYVSQSSSAIDIAVEHGWAVAIRSERTIRPDWRRLGDDEGLPALEPVEVELRQAPANPSAALAHFRDLLEEAVREDLAAAP